MRTPWVISALFPESGVVVRLTGIERCASCKCTNHEPCKFKRIQHFACLGTMQSLINVGIAYNLYLSLERVHQLSIHYLNRRYQHHEIPALVIAKVMYTCCVCRLCSCVFLSAWREGLPVGTGIVNGNSLHKSLAQHLATHEVAVTESGTPNRDAQSKLLHDNFETHFPTVATPENATAQRNLHIRTILYNDVLRTVLTFTIRNIGINAQTPGLWVTAGARSHHIGWRHVSET